MLSKKNLIFLGAPGAGKGTVSAAWLEKHTMAHISTGDILRGEIARGTDLGKAASELMKKGALVPDDIVAGMVRSRLTEKDCETGFILDGFPRTIRQAELLADALKELGKTLDAVIYLKIDDETILKRLTARQNCKKCGAIYNKLFMPSKKEGICDNCGGELFQRPDDSLETAKSRLAVFKEQTQPLIDFYEKAGKLIAIEETDLARIVAKMEKELA